MNTNVTTAAAAPVANQETVAAYAVADRKGKAAIRTKLDREMRAALGAGDFATAQAHHATISALAPARAEKEGPDYAQALADRIATLRLAADFLESGARQPAGFPEGWEHPEELPKPGLVADAATVLASAKLTRATDRSDISAAIVAAVSDTDEWLTMTQVANKQGLPSSGAVAARLFPTDKDGNRVPTTVPGVEVRDGSDGSPKAVRRAV